MQKKTILLFPLLLFIHFYIFAQDMRQNALKFVEQNLSALKLEKSDIQDAFVSDAYTSMGISHIYFQQKYSGVKVYNAILNVAVTNNGRMVLGGNRFVSHIESKAQNQAATLSAEQAVEKAAQHLGLTITNKIERKQELATPNAKSMAQKVILSDAGISREEIPAELVWVLKEDETLQLCWNLVIYEKNKADWWEVRVSANTGEFIAKNNWVNHCHFNHKHEESCFETPKNLSPLLPKVDKIEETLAANDYNVYDIPLESPSFGPRTIVNSPWNKAGVGNNATSLKWTNDGTTAYTSTRGNNVWAKDDIAGDNETTIGASAVSATNDFNFPLTLSAAPSTYTNAAITNLFYWNNIIHDVLYQYGFDEPSGNFQNSNQGRGGNGSDYVYADAQDGSGTNNANFATPPDGQKPRMQMFLWSGGGGNINLVVNSPSGIAGTYTAGSAAFNPSTPPSTTGNLIITSPAKGCSALTNASQVNGKIAVIDRGSCTFATKVKNAQNAGAIGVIVVDSATAATPPTMGGTDPTINILSCSVTKATGTTLKNSIQAGTVNGTINAGVGTQLDGDFDNGIVSHEYGHGVSNRLTGGPSNTSCLANAEQMGEGWSDYISLMLTTDWATAQANDVRGIGTFAIGQPTTGTGIREYPYSYNMTVSPYNYNYARANPQVHALGSAWASMLWDMTWNIINMTPANPNIYSLTGGNNIALRLVMEGMKLQPCSPGFVDGRDAILLADDMLYNSAHRCAIWAAFARRGLGYSASQGSSSDATDGSQAFDVPQGVSLTISNTPNMGTQNGTIDYNLKTQCECGQNNNLVLKATLPTQLDYVSSSNGGTYNSTTREVTFPSFNLASGQSNGRTIQAVVNNSFAMPIAYFNDDVESGGANWSAANLSGTIVNFAISTANVNSPTHAWSIADAVTPSDNTLRLANQAFMYPNTSLAFTHYNKAETNYDGGVVEISLNNGSTWQDLGNFMTQNGYNGTIAQTDNVLVNRGVFTGETQFRRTVIDLSSFVNQFALIRFRFATDTQNGTMLDATGWVIDDIQFISDDTCIYVTALVSNGTISDNASTCTPLVANFPTAIENANANGMKIYPNPTNGQLFVELPTNVSKGQINVYNMMGQVVKTLSITENKTQVIEMNGLSNGAYLLEINDGQNAIYQKVMKQD